MHSATIIKENRNVVRTQRTKKKTKRRSLRRNRKHAVE
jgi:hypothetical protein